MLSCIHPKYATELTSLQNSGGHFILSNSAKEMLDDMHKRKIDMADEKLLYRIKHPPKAKHFEP